MKKLLLSSIIMFGVCGFVNAQNATDAKLSKAAQKAATTNVAPTPQKAASDVIAAESKVAVLDQDAADLKNTEASKAEKVKQTQSKVKAVDAAGVVVDDEAAKKMEMKKAEAAKKTKQN